MSPDAPPQEPGISGKDPSGSALLIELSTWREQLARSIARNNLSRRSGEIAAAVNRIVFTLLLLRVANDRGFISTSVLREISEADDPYRRLFHISQAAGDPWADTYEPSRQLHEDKEEPVVEDRVIKKIIGQIAGPDCSSRFSGLTTDMMARIIGQYLGRTIRRSAVHQAAVVDTHDSVLSGPRVEPTPAIVEYLVTSTLRVSGRNRSRRDILPPRCIDPACGAGLVLIPAYRHLIAARAGNRATFSERREILLDSVHGLDIDPHAVAATRILLFLTLCEGETASTLPSDFFTVAQGVLQDLRYTIRCGNALITPDIASDESWAFCPVRDRHQLKMFSWAAGFPEIFSAGGFDVVFSNPPEGPLVSKEWIQQYFQRNYSVYDPSVDRSAYFVEQGLRILMPAGVLGYCMGDRWLRGKVGSALRLHLGTYEIAEIVDLPCTGGSRSGCGTSILMVINRTPATPKKFPAATIDPVFSHDADGLVKAARFPVDPVLLAEGGWALRDTRTRDLISKLERAGTPLDDVVMGQVHTGTRAGIDPVFVIGEDERIDLLRRDPRAKPFIMLLVSGPDIARYRIAGTRFAIIVPRGWTDAHNTTGMSPWRWFRRHHPAIADRLKKTGEPESHTGAEGYWWEAVTGGQHVDRRHGIVFPAQFRVPAFAYDSGWAFPDETVSVIGSSSLYLTGLLNSRLIAFFLDHSIRYRTGQVSFTWEELRNVPIYTPELDDPADRARHDRIVALVTRMNDRQKNLQKGKPDLDPGVLELEIAAIGKKIDVLVYGMYGLTKEEVTLIESGSSM